MGKDIPNDTILFWKKDITFNGVLEYMRKIICTYGYIGTYDELNTSDGKIIVIRHRLEGRVQSFYQDFLDHCSNKLWG